MSERVPTQVEGHRLVLSNLDKVLWPRTGTTKAAALSFFAQVAPAMLPHVRRRPASFLRFPDGVDGQRFYAKNPPPGLPDWVPTVEVPGRDGAKPHVAVDSLAVLMAMANLGALEVHVPQWSADTGPRLHDRLVVDLDPGEGTDIVDCCRAALWVREALAADGLGCWVKTSGSKGLHLLAPLVPSGEEAVLAYAKGLARRLQAGHPEAMVSSIARAERYGRVLLDAGQNSTAKTTAAPYTLRALPVPGVSTPLTWDEVAACRSVGQLAFTPDQVLARVAEQGDLLAGLCDPEQAAPLP